MRSSLVDNTRLLRLTGQDAFFENFILRVFLGFELYTLNGSQFEGTPIYGQLYQMLVETKEVALHEPLEGSTFYVTDGTYKFNFEVVENARPDGSGTSNISLNYIDKELLP
jgi:hypothetical protein